MNTSIGTENRNKKKGGQKPQKNKIYIQMTATNRGCVTANTHISIKLADKAWEIVVLEIPGQDEPGELHRVPNHEATAGGTPRYDQIQRRVVDQIEGLGQKRRDRISL